MAALGSTSRTRIRFPAPASRIQEPLNPEPGTRLPHPASRIPDPALRGAVTVTADVHADGHDVLAAAVMYRRVGDVAWRETPMRHAGNDRWEGTFAVDELGRYEYTVEGWIDRFESWRYELSKKFGAGQDVSSELLEGGEIVREVSEAPAGSGDQDRPSLLSEAAAALANAGTAAELRVSAALSESLRDAMRARPDRTRATRFDRVLQVSVERERARFGAWYEMFPRSAGTDPSRSATFDQAADRLPYVASMGFDVLYLPPVHPIGRSFPKGPNNKMTPGPNDPGSPWAIGSEEGGHMAIEPGLGTIEDFDRFVASAARHGLEIALDIAFQASP